MNKSSILTSLIDKWSTFVNEWPLWFLGDFSMLLELYSDKIVNVSPPWDDMTVYEFVLPSCLFLKVLFADIDNIILCFISINKLVMIIMNQ